MAFSSVNGYYSHLKFNSRKGVHPYSVPHFREVIFVSPLTVRDTAAESCRPANRAFRNFTHICTAVCLVHLPGSKSWVRRIPSSWFWLEHQEFSARSFIDTKWSVPCSQQPATGPPPEPHPHTLFLLQYICILRWNIPVVFHANLYSVKTQNIFFTFYLLVCTAPWGSSD